MSRATKNYVSAYQRDRVFTTALYANESRELVTDFNSLLEPGQSIIRAVWDTFDTVMAVMAEPQIDGSEAKIRISAQYAGKTRIRLGVTLNNGNTYSAWHVIRVLSAPYFNNQGWVTGPQQLVAVPAEEPLP